jgi:inorganic pyrophosphatase
MSLNLVPAGKDLPNDFNVIIEIPTNGDPVKYEVDKESGALFVDRFMGTSMQYPCNYGYIPHTLGDDGDPVDVLVITPVPLVHGSVIRCRALGVLNMTDEAGGDAKLLAVPIEKVCRTYADYKSIADVSPHLLDMITHFFEHYKDLDKGKWVKVEGWGDVDAAHKEITDGVKREAEAKK